MGRGSAHGAGRLSLPGGRVVCLAVRAMVDTRGGTTGTVVVEGHGTDDWRVVANTVWAMEMSTVDHDVPAADVTFCATMLAGGRSGRVTLRLYVEDRGTPARPADRIWLGVYDARGRPLTGYGSTGAVPAGATAISRGKFWVRPPD